MQGAGNGEYRKGLWTEEEDRILTDHVKVHGKGKWNQIAKVTGLKRCGKSCRLRWMNYLSPSVKRGVFSEEEDDLIIRLHKLLGNRWSLIAGRVPGRTDNQVKNHWNTHLSKKLGIKQKKCKVSASSSKFSEELEANSKTKLNSNDGSILCHKGEAEIHAEIQDNSEKIKEMTSLQDPVLFDDCYDNFGLSNNDPFSCAPNLMEFLDHSLDFLWYNL
ncbi:hypothetical protein POTOM_042071 [Populus tomentosa]|uniref:Transcription factor WER-like n=1 Tax=Populus tomentosa TaxID=118781 RepID=A0A8X7YJQ7_POPTO|nr:hypothetical protein POTOM_042071 [Populus tomentosa]